MTRTTTVVDSTTPLTKKVSDTTKATKKAAAKRKPVPDDSKANYQQHCRDSRDCFHGPCVITRTLGNGRIVLENRDGYVRLAYVDEPQRFSR